MKNKRLLLCLTALDILITNDTNFELANGMDVLDMIIKLITVQNMTGR